MHMGIWPALYVCAPYMCLVPMEAKIGVEFPGTGVTDVGNGNCGCWELVRFSSRAAIAVKH